MSSKALRTVLFPEPESPVRMTSWRPTFRAVRELPLARFTAWAGSSFDAALVRARNAHVFAVFRHGASCDVNSVFLEFLGNLFVGQGLGGVFLVDHFFDQPLQGLQRHTAAFRAVDGLAEEGTELDDPLRGVRILTGDRTAHGRRMHAHLF